MPRMWERIRAARPEVQHPTNKEYSENPKFVEACNKAGIEPTARQASKFRMKKGKAYNGK
mgnify:CR=1 FL=1